MDRQFNDSSTDQWRDVHDFPVDACIIGAGLRP